MFKSHVVKKGGFLLETGARCNKLSFVQTGLLRMFAVTESKEVTQWISSKGYCSTDLASFVFETPSRWTIQALVDSELYTITKEDYYQLNNRVPRWSEIEKSFLTHCFTTLEDRVFSHLSMTAEERHNFFSKTIENSLTKYHYSISHRCLE